MNFENDKIINKKQWVFILLIGIGIMARFFLTSFGNNYDFESYKIVGKIVSKGGNVYAETNRYNYGFIFSLVQGLGYKLTCRLPNNYRIFRAYIVCVLTLADLGITIWIAKRYSIKAALFFFLNPLSIIITGYHTQFDNIAVFFALMSMEFYDENEKISKRDIISILFLTMSLLTKHILYAFFIWILFNKGQKTMIKRLMYACIPPFLFLVSFIPFGLMSNAAYKGIIHNVFLYRSYNNYPLLAPIFKLIHIPTGFYFPIYIFIMLLLAIAFRKKSYEQLLLLYLVSMVAFASAIANQYLIIALVPLALYHKKTFYWVYNIVGTVYCIITENELNMGKKLCDHFPSLSSFINMIGDDVGITITVMALILAFFVFVYQRKENVI